MQAISSPNKAYLRGNSVSIMWLINWIQEKATLWNEIYFRFDLTNTTDLNYIYFKIGILQAIVNYKDKNGFLSFSMMS